MSFTWKSGSRRPRRRRRRSRPRMPRLTAGGSIIPRRSAFRRCAQRIARHYRDTYGCAVDAERIVVTTGSSGGFILAFLAMFEPGDRVAVTVPGYPPYRHILTALGCEPVLIETSSDTRHALTGEALLAAHRKTPLKGVLVGSPGQSHGHDDVARGAHRPDRSGGERRHPVHFRRDLSRPRLCVSGGDGGGAFAACAGDQFVLEIFLHDRLAGRLDGGAGTAGAADRAAAAKPVDLGADAVADRGRGGVRRRDGDGSDQARLSGEPPHPDRGTAARPASPNSCPPTARSISMPTFRISPPTVSNSPSRCWRRRMWRRRPASTSIRSMAARFIRFSYARSADEMREAVTRIARWLG